MIPIKIAASVAVCLWFLFFFLEHLSDEKTEKAEKLYYSSLKTNMLFILWIFIGFLNKWW